MDMNEPTVGSLVWHLSIRWRAAVDRAVAPLGLTHAQYSVLATLHALTERNGEPTQRELAGYARLQPIFVSKLVRALEAAGHVRRRADESDARAVRLSLTETGRTTALAARATVRALDGALTRPLGGSGGAGSRELAAVLRTLIDHSEESGGTE